MKNLIGSLLLFVMLIDFVVSRLSEANESDLIAISKKIIENIENCENSYPKIVILVTDDKLRPTIHNERDVICGYTRMAHIKEVYKNNLNEALLDQAINITIRAIKQAKFFTDLSRIVESEIDKFSPGEWLVLVSNITNPGRPLEKSIKDYIDYSIAHIRVRIFDIRSESNPNENLKSTTSSAVYSQTIATFTTPAATNTETPNIASRDRLDEDKFHSRYEKLRNELMKLKESIDGFSLNTWLTSAMQNNDLDEFKYIFDAKQISPEYRFAGGKTFLHKMIEDQTESNNRLPFIRYLIESKGLDPNVVDNKQRSVMHYAASRDLATLAYLASKGGDVNKQDARGFQAVHYAIIAKQLPILKYLIEKLGVDPRTKITRGYELIHFACNYGCDHCVEYLVTVLKIDPNTRSDYLFTPLHESAKSKNIAIVKFLVETAKVDLNARDYENKTALESAKEIADNQIVVDYLKSKIERIDVSSISPPITSERPVTRKPEENVDIRQQDKRDMVEIFINALQTGDFVLFKSIFEKDNISVDRKFENLKTFLHFTADFDRLDMVRYLIEEKSMNPNVRDQDAVTPLHYASRRSTELVKYLVSKQADIYARDNETKMPIHWAASAGHLDNVKFFIETKNQNPKIVDINGFAPIDYAHKFKKLNVVDYFLRLNSSSSTYN